MGFNDAGGTIITSSASGAVNGGDGTSGDVGGLVGFNSGTIVASYATGNADGQAGTIDRVGGLVGRNLGTIVASYATGAVAGGSGTNDRVGGLVGDNTDGTVSLPRGTIIDSYATGNVTGSDTSRSGKLVGVNTQGAAGTATASYGFGTLTTAGTADPGLMPVDRSTDATAEGDVATASAITVTNSYAAAGDSPGWSTDVWEFPFRGANTEIYYGIYCRHQYLQL